MRSIPKPEQICAVVTTYRPPSSMRNEVNAILQQVAKVIIIDDSGECSVSLLIDEWFSEIGRVFIYHHSKNLGIACALNTGVKLAAAHGFEWVLTMDDDSLPLPRMVDRLTAGLSRIPPGLDVAVIGMEWMAENDTPKCIAMPRISEKRGIITSGSLLSMKAFLQIGGFREEFFIDVVDYDFCLRARMCGFHIFRIHETGFIHRLGTPVTARFFGLAIRSSNYSPVRLYYFFRNSTVLAQEQLRCDPLYSLAVIGYYFVTCLKILLVEREKYKKFVAILRGVFDGSVRRLGPKRVLPMESSGTTPGSLGSSFPST